MIAMATRRLFRGVSRHRHLRIWRGLEEQQCVPCSALNALPPAAADRQEIHPIFDRPSLGQRRACPFAQE